jgi:hypothetical protein
MRRPHVAAGGIGAANETRRKMPDNEKYSRECGDRISVAALAAEMGRV